MRYYTYLWSMYDCMLSARTAVRFIVLDRPNPLGGRPFELIGAPYIDDRLIGELRALELLGVVFRESWFVPTFHKGASSNCGGRSGRP